MNTSKIKNFAPKVRLQLREAIERKLDYILTSDTPDLRENTKAVDEIRSEAKRNRDQLIEKVAYTWFNRLVALRYMDAHEWHPFRCRMITPIPGNTQPEILQLIRSGDCPEGLELDMARINGFLNGSIPSVNPMAEAYRMAVIAACNYYHRLMPFVFEEIKDYTELLLPDDLLTDASIASGIRTQITDEDCAEVEIIGWLYQFYISEKKDAVMARKKAVPKEDIPAVTQLFTPHWIVKYMVENSLGKLWMHNHPESRLIEKMDYYVPDDPDFPKSYVTEGDDPEGPMQYHTTYIEIKKPEEIRICDPACGSGHILTYAFDLLYEIYEEQGYAQSEIPKLILTHNLFGIEIDERAAELAYFSLMMKGQQKYGRFIRRLSNADADERTQPNICCLQDVVFEDQELANYSKALDMGDLFDISVRSFLNQFSNAKSFGSLIRPILQDTAYLEQAIVQKHPGDDIFLYQTHLKVLKVLEQSRYLQKSYHVVVANPPYMGGKGMNKEVSDYLKENYTDVKSDLFSAFIVRNSELAVEKGQLGFMTPFVWMFISSYEKLRSFLLDEKTISSLIQLEYSGFDGATVPICTFTIQNAHFPNNRGGFVRLSDFRGAKKQGPKTLEILQVARTQPTEKPAEANFFRASAADFKKIPGSPIAYWVSERVRHAFEEGELLEKISNPRKGLATTDNGRFLRLWHEVNCTSLGFEIKSRTVAKESPFTWFPLNKGGSFRKWYGNKEFVVKWKNDGEELKQAVVDRYNGGSYTKEIRSEEKYFRDGITWSALTSSKTSFRRTDYGALFDSAGSTMNPIDDDRKILGLLNSPVVTSILQAINPTLNFGAGTVGNIPVVSINLENKYLSHVEEAVGIARLDWDNFETSWDFQDSPFLRNDLKSKTLSETWNNWNCYCGGNIARMQELETENNRLWIDAYGLQDELTPEVPEEEITLARADKAKDMVAFISYAVGCMLGRYALDKPGLILANQGDTLEEYQKQIPDPIFPADDDAIIPVLDGEWFEDDIEARFRRFLTITFGEETLNENIRFIEGALGKELRKYFTSDFYKNHVQTYKKRPIYWMFQSPNKSFQALIYMHRYTKDTVNTMLNDYLREYLHKLSQHLDSLVSKEASGNASASEKKEIEKIRKAILECEEWERSVLLPLAQARIEIDLDDGVKQNYPKFGSALAKVPGLS